LLFAKTGDHKGRPYGLDGNAVLRFCDIGRPQGSPLRKEGKRSNAFYPVGAGLAPARLAPAGGSLIAEGAISEGEQFGGAGRDMQREGAAQGEAVDIAGQEHGLLRGIGTVERADGKLYWGAGTDTDVITASTKALLSAFHNMTNGGN